MKTPEKMLELYQFEECPYCVRVRTAFTDMGLSYIIHNVSRDKSQRESLTKLTSGLNGVPTLVDSNTDTIIADDDNAIIAYVTETYNA